MGREDEEAAWVEQETRGAEVGVGGKERVDQLAEEKKSVVLLSTGEGAFHTDIPHTLE